MMRQRSVFIDVDTQVDFMLPEGKLYVPGAESLIPNLQHLIRFAMERRIPVVSSVDAHSPDDPEFEHFPPHCVKGTPGQEKILETLLPVRTLLVNEEQPAIADDEFAAIQQWMIEKQKFDLFTNVNAVSLLRRLNPTHYVVFGVATEYCVKAAVLGLLRLGRPISLVEDAIRGIDPDKTKATLDEILLAGVNLVRTRDILAASLAA
jgi:nicotinamidase/pyrazinamidase